MTKETLGKIILDLNEKPQDIAEVGDLMPLERERYLRALQDAVDEGIKHFDGDFYIEVMLKKEQLFQQMLPRIFAIPRQTCPTPWYNQDAFKYKRSIGTYMYLWSVPSPESCDFLIDNADQLPIEYRELIEYVMKYRDLTLLRLCNDLNGESHGTIDLIEPPRTYSGISIP